MGCNHLMFEVTGDSVGGKVQCPQSRKGENTNQEQASMEKDANKEKK